MAPDSPEERMTRTETEMEYMRTAVSEIRADLKGLPLQVRRQMVAAMRRQRRDIQIDTERAIDRCRQIQTERCHGRPAVVPAIPPKPADQAKPLAPVDGWDVGWLRQALIGLAILGSLVGGAIATVRGGDRPPAPPIPAPAQTRQGGNP